MLIIPYPPIPPDSKIVLDFKKIKKKNNSTIKYLLVAGKGGGGDNERMRELPGNYEGTMRATESYRWRYEGTMRDHGFCGAWRRSGRVNGGMPHRAGVRAF